MMRSFVLLVAIVTAGGTAWGADDPGVGVTPPSTPMNGGPTEAGSTPSRAVPTPAVVQPTQAIPSGGVGSPAIGGLRVDVVFLPDADGRLVPVPRDAKLEEYLRSLGKRTPELGAEQSYSVVRVSLDGSATNGTNGIEVARLTATLRVKVTAEGWVRVPLAMQEAVLRSQSHRFLDEALVEDVLGGDATKRDSDEAEADDPLEEATASTAEDPAVGGSTAGDALARAAATLSAAHEVDAVFLRSTRAEGLVWLFRGRGVHELTLEISVPVRLQSPSRRLQLQLPETAVSSVRLAVSQQPISLTLPAGPQWNVEEAGTKGSTIEAFGLGTQLDLAWEPRPSLRASGVSSQSTTSLEVRPNDRTVVLQGTQIVKVLRGSVSELRVRLPTGFEVRDVAARVVTGGLTGETTRLEPADGEKGWTLLVLPDVVPERSQLELTWTLESPPRAGRGVRIDGFEFEGVRDQSGEIAVQTLAGHDVSVRTVRNAHRIDVAELSRSTSAVSAYRFLRQPFQLLVDVTEVEPHFTAQAKLGLHVTRDDLQLDGEVRVRVYRGAVRQVELEWPEYDEEGWVLSPPNVPGLVEQFEVVGTGAETRIRFQLLEPTVGEFTLPVRALRPIEPSPDPLPLHLPTMAASYRLPTSLRVTRAIDVDVTLVPNDTATARREGVEVFDGGEASPVGEGHVPVESLRVDPGQLAFGIDVEARMRRVVVEGSARPTVQRNVLRMEQRLEFDVQYGYVDAIVLRVPRVGGAEYAMADGTPLLPEPMEGGATVVDPTGAALMGTDTGIAGPNGERAVSLPLPDRRTGRFVVVVSSERPIGTSAEDSLVVEAPLANPIGVDEFAFTVWTAPSGGWSLRVDDPSWEEATTVRGETAWTSRDRPGSVSVRLERAETSAVGELTVRRALIRTLVSGDGVRRSWSRFDVVGATNPLIVTLPEGMSADEFLWNGRSLTRDEVLATPPGSNRFALDVGRGSEGLLLVRTHATGGAPLGWSDAVSALAPSLPGAAWVEQTVWEVSLPAEQYLFQPPRDYTSNYDWLRDPVFWKRVPRAGFADSVAWIGDRPTRTEQTAFEGRNGYQFVGLGPRAEIAFRTASRSCLVLFGAGLSLALGFVLLKIPVLRNVLVLLGLGFLLAVLSLWFPEPVLVLLQPALLGLLLALTAALIDSAFNRGPASSPVLSFPTPLDFSVGGSGGGSAAGRHEASTRSGVGFGESSSGDREAELEVGVSEPVSSSTGAGR